MKHQCRFWILVFVAISLMPSSVASAQDTAGIGVALARDGDHVVIGQLLPDGNAAKSGKLGAGDRIVAITDVSEGITDVSKMSLESIVALIRGKSGSTLHLTVVPKGKAVEDAITIPLTRGTIPQLAKWGDGKLIPAGREFPKISLTVISDSGGTLTTSDLRGRLTIFKVWASWCGPCLKLMDDYQELAKEYASYSDRLQFVGASVDDKLEPAHEMLKKHEWNVMTNVWLDEDAIKALHINSVPVTYLIDSDGNVLANSEDTDFQVILAKLIEGVSEN